jgi:prepilin-type N-terminal cleavage/methylation domain-containing protein
MYSIKNKGFTLAELLLALTVIGVVASLTIPDLISSIENKNHSTAFVKTYSVLTQATNKMKDDNDGSLLNIFTHNDAAVDAYCEYLTCVKRCSSGNTFGDCFVDVANAEMKDSDGNIATLPVAFGGGNTDVYSGIVLADGVHLIERFDGSGAACDGVNPDNYCGIFFIDINGRKAPNVTGKDIFSVIVTADRGVILGTDYNWLPNWGERDILTGN